MSAKIMGEIWELDIAHNKAVVLLAMADHADHDGKNVFPRVGFIAWKIGCGERTVRRVIAELRDDGILLPCGHTPGGVVIYEIRLAHVARKAPYVAEQAGRPLGRFDRAPRESITARTARTTQKPARDSDKDWWDALE